MELLTILNNNSLTADITDMIVTAGSPIMIRKMNSLVPVNNSILTPKESESIIKTLLTEDQWNYFVTNREIDTAISVSGINRFRINCFWQRNSPGMAIRPIPNKIKRLEELGLPSTLYELIDMPSGLVLIAGPTGQGKSTTLASIIEHINQTRMCHIMTIEDPVEFMFKNKKSVIEQREVGTDTPSFNSALKHTFRQNPNVVMIGELRDLETIQLALTVAETGPLVISTLHTTTAAQTISRIIDVFPAQAKKYISLQLSMALNGIICQRLIRKADERGLILAYEIMKANPAIKNLIKEHNVQGINNVIQTGMAEGMITFNRCLEQLLRQGIITCDEASRVSPNLQELMKMLEG